VLVCKRPALRADVLCGELDDDIEETVMQKIGVVGSGQMGSGIAHMAAMAGCRVQLFDVDETQLAKSLVLTRKNLSRQVNKGLLTVEAAEEGLGFITTNTDAAALADCELIVEAVPEVEEIKLDIFRMLDRIAAPAAILASNTSSISITKIAKVTQRPDQVIGMHFMNPVPVMKLVEVIRGLATSEQTFEKTRSFIERLGKEIAVAQDYSGFIVNRVLIPMINEAIFAHYEGVGSIEDIDKAMMMGTNQPMGPFALADFIGLDTVLAIMKVLYDGFKDSKYRSCPLLVNMVEAGYYGRKSGRGFYSYD
jgi:3-hydroxybutyryl-CoA dehydrogenase